MRRSGRRPDDEATIAIAERLLPADASLAERLRAPVLGLGVFLAAFFCLEAAAVPNQAAPEWLANGLPLAAFLRSDRERWPLIAFSAWAGCLAAQLATAPQAALLGLLVLPAANVLQALLCAAIVRRRGGRFFDILDPGAIARLLVAGAAATLVTVILISLFDLPYLGTHRGAGAALARFAIGCPGLFVLALPILALTAPRTSSAAPLDALGAALLLLLLGAQAEVFLSRAPPAPFVVMPIAMLVAWRHGLPGAGLAALLAAAVSVPLTAAGHGPDHLMALVGVDAVIRGAYLQLYLAVVVLVSLPVAVTRAHQQATEARLAEALAASEQRAAMLAKSEAAAWAAEALVKQSQDRLRRIVETSSDIICTLDAQGRFLEIGENCAAVWGWSRSELIGRPATAIMHPDDRAFSEARFRALAAGRPLVASLNRFVRPDGTEVPMSWSGTWDAEEQVCHGIGRDMTAYNALEAEVRRAQRLEAVGRLSGGLAHDFNNILTIVLGGAETLAAELSGPQQRLAAVVEQAAEQGSALIRRLLAFGRRQPLSPRSFDPGALVRAMEPLIAQALGEGVRLELRPGTDAPAAYADPSQTEAAILNLCLNARDAMPEGGVVTISTGGRVFAEDDVDVRPAELRAGAYAVISVTDEGCGITPEVMARIFEPFFTTKPVGQGSGLGLSMVHGFASQSEGCVDIVSAPGRGTSVSLFLPALGDPEPPGAAATQGEGLPERGTETVLLVEDNALVREHARGLVEGLGYTVLAAESPAEALEILAARADVDLLFTDVVMPGSLSGWRLGELAAARQPSLRVLYTSGHAVDELGAAGRLPPGVTLLPKPYARRALASALRAVLDRVP